MPQEAIHKVNLNQKILFQLTPAGHQYLEKFWEEEVLMYGTSYKPAPLDMDKSTGLVAMKLHEFMHTFGAGMYVGSPVYVVDMSIEILPFKV